MPCNVIHMHFVELNKSVDKTKLFDANEVSFKIYTVITDFIHFNGVCGRISLSALVLLEKSMVVLKCSHAAISLI